MDTFQERMSEKWTKELIKRDGYLIMDVRHHPDYMAQDIDFLIKNPITENISSIEVKEDNKMSDTGNLFVETIANADYGTDGWFYKCKAKKMIYWDFINRIGYLFRMKDLRDYVNANINSFGEGKAWDRELHKMSIGLLVPLADFMAAANVEQVPMFEQA